MLPRDVATRRSLPGGLGLGDLILVDPAGDDWGGARKEKKYMNDN